MKTFLKLTPEQAIALRDQLQSMNLGASYPDTLCYHIVYADTTAAKMMRAPATAKECLAKKRYVILSDDACESLLADAVSDLEDRVISGAEYDMICAAARRNDGTEIFLHHEELNFEGDDYDWAIAARVGKKVRVLDGLYPADELKEV